MHTDESHAPIRRLHGHLVHTHFYPVALASGIAVAALVGRVVVTGRLTFVFLAWNLFLAWVPYVLSLAIARFDRIESARDRRATSRLVAFTAQAPLLLLGIVWLLFLPNAPYLVTDLIHLHPNAGVPLWFDATLLVSFALAGFALMNASLLRLQRLIERRSNRIAGWLFVIASLLLAAVGIYVGRFLRWNSWDVILRPRLLAHDTIVSVLHPLDHVHACLFSLFIASTAFAVYLFPATMARR